MSASAVRAGKAEVEIGIRNKLDKGLKAAAARLRNFAKSAGTIGAAVAGAGTAVLGPIMAATARFLGTGDALSKLSDKTGASVEALSELVYAAEQSGASAQSVQNGFKGMARVIGEATDGSQTAVDSLAKLGLSVEDLGGMSQDDRFTVLADRISQIDDPSLKAAAAMEIFGRAGQDLLPMMLNGAGGIDELRQRARDLGLVMTGEDAAAATLLGDLWGDLVKIAGRLGDVVGGALAPVLIPMADWLIGIGSAVVKWVDANRPLIVTVAKVAAMVLGIGTVITGVATAALGLSFVFSGLAAGLALAAKLAALVGGGFAFLASPIGIALVAIVAATVAFFAFTESGQQMWATIKSTLSQAFAWVKQVFGGIYAAIAAGDLGLAAQIAWEAVKVAFAAGVNQVQSVVAGMVNYLGGMSGVLESVFAWLGEVFGGFATYAKETFGGIIGSLANGDWAGAANIAWLSIKLAWQTGVAEVSSIWSEFTTGLMIGLDSATSYMHDQFASFTGWMGKQMVKLWGLFDTDLQVDAVIKTLEEDTQRKRDQIKADLESRNGERAAQLSKDLAKTDAELAELRAARAAALAGAGSAGSGLGSLFAADPDKLARLLAQAKNLPANPPPKPNQPKKPEFDPGDVGPAAPGAGSGAGKIGTFDARALAGQFGDDRIDKEQLAEAIKLNNTMLEINRHIRRQRGVYS